jgi:hypothetical protein
MVPKTLEEWSLETVQELCSAGLGESDTHDFKTALPDARNTTKISCAFANTFGGFLIYGVRERSGSFCIEGVDADNELSARLRQRIRADPHIEVSLPKLISVPGSAKVLYVFAIPQSTRRPHLPSVAEERFFWKRSNSICEYMTLEEIRYQMLSYDEKKEKLTLLVIDLAAKAARLKRLADATSIPGSNIGMVFTFDVIDRVLVEAYSFLKDHRRIIENIERLREYLMGINFETTQLSHLLALSETPGYKASRLRHFTTYVNTKLQFSLDCIAFVQRRLKELHDIDDPYEGMPI